VESRWEEKEALIPVGAAAAVAAETLDAGISVRDAQARIAASGMQAWPVCSHEGVIGVIGRDAIESAAENGDAAKSLSEVIDRGEFPHVHTDHSLHSALDRMGTAGVEALPVVSRANVHQLLGIVTLDDVLAQYRVRNKEATK
jgi:chloride channel protein, CIC family